MRLFNRISVIALLAGAVQATMAPRLTFEQLVSASEAIVHGHVGRTWNAWDKSHQFIWTHHELEVADALKGTAAKTVVVSEPGGTVDGFTMQISGVMPYAAGEEVVLFLYRTPIGYLRTAGVGQGKYNVIGNSVRGGFAAQTLLDTTSPRRAETDLRRLEGMRLSDFKARVRALTEGR